MDPVIERLVIRSVQLFASSSVSWVISLTWKDENSDARVKFEHSLYELDERCHVVKQQETV